MTSGLRSKPMRLATTLMILLAGLASSAGVFLATGGTVVFLFLPLLFGLPFAFRRRG